MNGAGKFSARPKSPDWVNNFADSMPPKNRSRVEVHYDNPSDVLRFELSTKQAFQAMGHSKENLEILTSLSLCTVKDVIAQCESVEAVGSIFVRIAELTVKLALLRMALRFRFSKNQLRRINAVERDLEILLASLYQQQRVVLLMTRVKDAPGYVKGTLRTRYYRLPPHFKPWRDLSKKGSEEELRFISTIEREHNFFNTNLRLRCIILRDCSAQLIPLWNRRNTG